MINIPDIKAGLVAVSRDCFPMSLSESRRRNVAAELKKKNIDFFECETIIENENDVKKALHELDAKGVNALVVYLGNFGPEGPETILAQRFDGPVMFAGAAEESGKDLIDGRGDAYCGMLNASYNIGLRKLSVHIPEYPIGSPNEVADMVLRFLDVARVIEGLSKLKIFTFGPRPQDFLACNAPIKPLFDLGIEIQENSELDLYAAYKAHGGDPGIPALVKEMESELGAGKNDPGFLSRLAQYEITLLDWAEKNLGASKYFIFANKCWPAFQTEFGFVPCYVNARLAGRGIPVACETDIYGALSEYMLALATCLPPTLLDINNTAPLDMYEENTAAVSGYSLTDLFMGFHCGNTPLCHITNGELKYQLIMKRALEPQSEPDITRGTYEGRIKPGDVTLFRLQSTADGSLKSYIAQGEVLDVDPASFGGIGVFAVAEMARFYRHVLIEKRYPHHAGVGFAHAGRTLFSALRMLGVEDVAFNQPKNNRYLTENPF